MKKRLPVILFSLLAIISVYNFTISRAAVAVTYEVGPGKPYANIGDVPWESLQPGDTVLIYYRSTPYKEKWVICRQGTAAAPITVRGVLGPNGELPVIDGNGATTRLALDFWSETRGVIKIGGASIPADTMPRYITIENLDIRSARSSYTFTDDGGATQTYQANASSIYVEKGENITTTSLPNGRRNKSYSQTLQATGGVTPYSWSLTSGSLPPGLSLNGSTGVISGKPATLGAWSFTVQVQDSQSPAASDTQALSITVTR